MGVSWKRTEVVKRLLQSMDDDRQRAFEQCVANYGQLGWKVIERSANPLYARLRYVDQLPGNQPLLRPRDGHDVVIWVDATGTVQVGQSEQ